MHAQPSMSDPDGRKRLFGCLEVVGLQDVDHQPYRDVSQLRVAANPSVWRYC